MEEQQIKRLDIELISAYTDQVIYETIENTDLTYPDLKILVIANLLNDKAGKFDISDVMRFKNVKSRRLPYIIVTNLLNLGYLEIVRKSRSKRSKGYITKLSNHYTISGKGIYIIRKYAEIFRKRMAEPIGVKKVKRLRRKRNNAGPEVSQGIDDIMRD